MEKLLYRDRKKERLPRIGEDMRKGKPGYAIAKTLLQAFTPSQPLAWIQPVGIGGHSAIKRNDGNSNTNDATMVESSRFKIYPNPANNRVTIEYQIEGGETNFILSFYSVTGGKIADYILPANQTKVTENINNFAEGIYFYSITANDKILQRGKLVITK